MILLDTSIVIAYYLPETYSDQAQALYAANWHKAVSNLIVVETLSVISRLVRTRSLSRDAADLAAELFNRHLDNGFYTRLDLRPHHFQLAGTWIARFDLPLKAPDALHLAVADFEQVPLVTADRQLARNAEALGISVELLAATSE